MILSPAKRLSELLEENDLSADALGKQIGISGSAVARWIRENKAIKLNNLLKIAEFFDCSVDFLCGRTYNMDKLTLTKPTFPARLIALLDNSQKSKNQIFKEIGYDRHTIYDWSNGVEPLSSSLIALADYFGCTVDYLIGIRDY